MTRIFTVFGVLGLAVLLSPTAAVADVKIEEPTKKAIDRGLQWLAARQSPDGSWSDGRYAHNTSVTSFALLAFMSQGHLPNQGTYGPEVAKGARFLMASARKSDGYLVGARGGNMYCHGMATLALAELWGNTGDDTIKPVLKKAVNLIIKTQNPRGGWRYEPSPTGADISVTIMQVMALRAAKNGGLHVPDITLKKAIAYINSCYHPQLGGFGYQPGGYPGFARTAAGTCVLYLSGKYDDQKINKAVEYLRKHFHDRTHFYYGHYYAAHAMHQKGGNYWEDWYGKIVKHFLPLQSNDGSWSRIEPGGVGPVYQTSIAVIILSVPAHYLPIFQR
jgi:squalene cyclase